MKTFKIFILCALCTFVAQAQKQYQLASPDGKLKTTITTGKQLTYDITFDGQQVLNASPLTMTLDNGEVWGENDKPSKASRKSVHEKVASPFYRADELPNIYNELTLQFKGFNVVFRAYDDGIAYRFVNRGKKPFKVVDEQVMYQFPNDAEASIPYVRKSNGYEAQFFNSFEAQYTNDKLSNLNKERLMFLPLIVKQENNVKVCITEVNLENYPGLYLKTNEKEGQLISEFAPYPKRVEQGGHNMLQMVVKEREDFIAKVDQPRSFPWRVAIVTNEDKDLAACDLGYVLAEPSRLEDISWIKPGKIAWDWWNNWNLDGVDFETGVNNPTYKAYIDFASKNGIEYVILDEGWAVNKKADLMQVVPEIDLEELVAYANSKNVGLVLWAGYHAFNRDMENVCRHYSEMGIKGFKVDFLDRDDQTAVEMVYRIAEATAKHKLTLDLHGIYKPTGINRTYPNIINFESVFGMEEVKWTEIENNMPLYDVTFPYIRMMAGPVDYTPGAMSNRSKADWKAMYSSPMSMGTRCHQLATYIVHDSPLTMLCDAPTNYKGEEECVEFITSIPVEVDATFIADGKLGEYIVTVRQKDADWYIGGMTNWDERDIVLDFSFLPEGKSYQATVFTDGINANKNAEDYQASSYTVDHTKKLNIHMASGGGFAIRLKAE